MLALECVLDSRSAKFHVPAAQHMGPDNSAWGGDRSLGSAATDLASAAVQALEQRITDPVGAEQPLHSAACGGPVGAGRDLKGEPFVSTLGSNPSRHRLLAPGYQSPSLEAEHERSDSLA